MQAEPVLKEVMDFASIRRNVIANLTESTIMSTTEAFDIWDRIQIDIHLSIDSTYEWKHDPELDVYFEYMTELNTAK